jgi:hypothetical protein
MKATVIERCLISSYGILAPSKGQGWLTFSHTGHGVPEADFIWKIDAIRITLMPLYAD